MRSDAVVHTLTRDLTARQVAILAAFRHGYAREHRPPTIREIMEATDTSSTSTVVYNLKGLAKKGYLRRVGDHYILVLQSGDPCPCCGRPWP